MAKGLLDILFDEIFDENWKGKHGEKLTVKELKWVNRLGRKGQILCNVYIPKNNGETSEIDVMYISQKGIFVFESKNYSGWIFGDEKSQYWTAMLPNREKNRFYNPVKQNRTHLKWLSNYVGKEVPLFSIIVFSERCELKKISIENPDIKVIKRDYTYGTVRRIWDSSPDALTEEEISELYTRLKELTNVDAAVKAAHKQNIEKKYKKPKEKPVLTSQKSQIIDIRADDDNSLKRVCPRCGRELVLRTARKGGNAGSQFYGCSGFPKCRYTEPITI